MNDNGVVGELRAINGGKRTKYVSLYRAWKERKHPSYLPRYRYSSTVNCPISVGMVPERWLLPVVIRITRNGQQGDE
jgi:hypothetical protein